MAYERNWAFSFDNDYSIATLSEGSRYQMWALKALLLGQLGGFTQGLWTVYGSSDGVTAGMDAVDRWGSTYDSTKLVRANSTDGLPRSWIVLMSPLMNGYNFYLNIAYDQGLDSHAGTWLSKIAPTGSSATATPTATTQWAFFAGAQLWFPTPTVPSNLRAHMCLSSTGDFFPSIGGRGRSHCGLAVVAPVGCNGSDLHPIWSYRHVSDPSNYGPFATGYFPSQLSYSGTNAVTTRATCGGNVNTNPQTSFHTELPDLLTGKFITMPMILSAMSTTTSYWHMRGRVPDTFIIPHGAGATAPVGTVLRDGSNNITHVLLGSIFVPANAVPNVS
jgi:hypothetical protein